MKTRGFSPCLWIEPEPKGVGGKMQVVYPHHFGYPCPSAVALVGQSLNH